MIAFDVYVNSLKVNTAGLEELAFVTASLNSTLNTDGRPDERRLHFSVAGINDKKFYSWVHYKLPKGDRVEIRIVDAKKTDEPKETKCSGGACDVDHQR